MAGVPPWWKGISLKRNYAHAPKKEERLTHVCFNNSGTRYVSPA
jgi:hypothetical protein